MAITADNGGITEDSQAATETDDYTAPTQITNEKKTESSHVQHPFEAKQMIVDVDNDVMTGSLI